MAKEAQAVSEKAEGKAPELARPVEGPALTDAERKAYKRALWIERMFSLWAPVTIFGAIFALYIILIELHTPAYHWAQPVMKAFGLLALLYFVTLLLARNFWKPFGRVRTVRHYCFEVLGELKAALSGKDAARRAFGDAVAAQLMRLYTHGEPEELLRHTEAVAKFVEKDLGRKKFGSDFVIGFVKAFAIAMLIRTVVIEPFKIPSGSMIPTLEIGDQIFVNKFIYGVRIPWTNFVPFQIIRAPERGDVIVFNNPVHPDVDYIKRIVGVGGDQVAIKDDTVFINGEAQPRTEVATHYKYMDQRGQTGPTHNNWEPRIAQLYEENLSGSPHPTMQEPTTSCGGTFLGGEPFSVPAGHVFVMGDNRDNSTDSRFGLSPTGQACMPKLTFVPVGNIKGKAMVVWLALGFEGIGHKIFGGTGFRTDRLFKPVR